jgi:hypothetical protein
MTATQPHLVAMYPTLDDARAAADLAARAGADPNDIRIDEPLDRVAALQGEMREEMDHTLAGPGNVGPFTQEMQRGMTAGAIVGAVVGLVLALPFAAIPFLDWDLWLRLLVAAIVGLALGGTVGWILGGGFAANRPEERLAAERGVPLEVPASEPVAQALAATNPIRLDLVGSDGHPIRPISSEPDESLAHKLGRHAAHEPRDS